MKSLFIPVVILVIAGSIFVNATSSGVDKEQLEPIPTVASNDLDNKNDDSLEVTQKIDEDISTENSSSSIENVSNLDSVAVDDINEMQTDSGDSSNKLIGEVEVADSSTIESEATSESAEVSSLTTYNGADIVEPIEEKVMVAIDAGHQAKGNSELEPIGPEANQSKAKVASGTRGTTTNIPEYELTLDVSIKLQEELITRGYDVLMIRETNDVNISNKERADLAAEANADVFIRIHADGSENENVNGILTLCQTSSNPYVSHTYDESRLLSDCILAAMVENTGAKNRGVLEVDNMSGINWATMPVTIVEMGLMTNPEEDVLMQTDEYQMKLVTGMADGVDSYFQNIVNVK